MSLKILHLPTSTGGNSSGLSLAEKELGYISDVLTFSEQFNKYDSDINLNLSQRNFLNRIYIRMKTFLKVRNKYDVYHFNFGTSLLDFGRFGLPLLDLPFYKKTAKKIVTYNGCDARQKYPSMSTYKIAACHEKNCYKGMCNSGKLDKIRQIKIRKMAKCAHHIFALNPDLLKFLPENASFVPYTISNWNTIKKVNKQRSKKIKIVHAPTNRDAKGTRYIETALSKLSTKYRDIEVIFVENKTFEDAIAIYQTADLVIDQVLIGWYGAFSVEVMKMGIPVACYIRQEDLKYIPSKMALDLNQAIINVSPFTIFNELEKVIENRAMLVEKGRAGLDYVHTWHEPKKIATTILEKL